jgi:hypothetical protein
MDMQQIRHSSMQILSQKEISIPSHLPILEETLRLREKEDILNRILALNVVVAVSYGFPTDKAKSWLKNEKYSYSFTREEQLLLEGKQNDKVKFQWEVESIYALSWVLRIVKDPDIFSVIPNDLVKHFPSFNTEETSERTRKLADIETFGNVIPWLDIYYLMHWYIVEYPTKKIEGLGTDSIVGRRKALEWVLSDQDWDNIIMDT